MSQDNTLEKLAEIEHQQWQQWSETIFARMIDYYREKKTLLDFINDMGERWGPNWKPYSELDESTKEFDRDWARKVLESLSNLPS